MQNYLPLLQKFPHALSLPITSDTQDARPALTLREICV